VARNIFLGNFVDIEMEESRGIIEKNYFDGSLTCVKLGESYPRILRNYFKQAYKNIIESNNKRDLAAGENWWGPAKVNSIKPLGAAAKNGQQHQQVTEKASSKKKVLRSNSIKNFISEKGEGKIKFEPFLKKPPDLTDVGIDLMEGFKR